MYPKNDIGWDLDKYLGSFNFRLSIDGIPQESMKVVSVSNVVSESDIVEYMLGPEPYVRKIPGKNKFAEVEVVRIYQGYDQFYTWRTKIEDGEDDLRTVTVEMLAPDLDTVVRKMTLHNCWPHRWQLPNLDASGSNPATETILLACERITQGISTALSPITSSGGAEGTTQAAVIGAAGAGGFITQDFDDSFWDKPSDLTDLEEARAAALELAAQSGQIFDPNEETWDPPEAVDDPTAEKQGGDGTGPVTGSTATGETMEFNESGDGEGPIGGRGEQEDLTPEEDGDSEGIENPMETDFGESAAADDPTAAKQGGDGTGPVTGSTATGETMEFDETTGDDGAPIDPNEETWDAPEAVDDPTAAKQGGDGTGIKRAGNATGETMEFEDTSDGNGIENPMETDFGESAAADDPTAANNGGDGAGRLSGREATEADDSEGSGPIGGREAPTADYGSSDGIENPMETGFGDSAAADDPTAANNGGDGSGPLSGREATEAADGEGSGPITDDPQDYGGSAATDDPTAANNGGDGSGPLSGREATEAAGGGGAGPITNDPQDYGGSAAADDPTAANNGGDGSGPIGGREATEGAGGGGSGPIGGREATEAAGGGGSGPITNDAEDFGGSAAADDPTAAQHGGDGSGPIGGRGAQEAADYGSPGSGPIKPVKE